VCPTPLRAPGPTPPVPADLDRLIALVEAVLRKVAATISKIPVVGPGLAAGIKAPTAARFLDMAEQSEAMSVYVGSLDFTKIVLTDGLGFGRRPFTVAVPLSSGFHVAMNVGDLCSWASRPRSETLIHELAHAWQSQHHSTSPTAFMTNSVRCQIAAIVDLPAAKAAAAAAASAAAIRSGVHNPARIAAGASAAAAAEDVSAYAYMPGKPFDEYAAEQIAEQVEDRYTPKGAPTPAVIAHISSLSAHARSPDNERSLTITSFHRKSTPGVVFP